MIKYLKYILIVFGSLGVLLVGFFYFQNQHDLHTYLSYRNSLSYDDVKANCKSEKEYYYPCFKEKFKEYISKVSITGRSIGLNSAFDFLEEDKKRNKFFSSKVKDITYSIHYIEINNIVLSKLSSSYFGFEFLRSSFIASVQRFEEKAFEFSENLIFGLESKEGLEKIKEGPFFIELSTQFMKEKKRFFRIKTNSAEQK